MDVDEHGMARLLNKILFLNLYVPSKIRKWALARHLAGISKTA